MRTRVAQLAQSIVGAVEVGGEVPDSRFGPAVRVSGSTS